MTSRMLLLIGLGALAAPAWAQEEDTATPTSPVDEDTAEGPGESPVDPAEPAAAPAPAPAAAPAPKVKPAAEPAPEGEPAAEPAPEGSAEETASATEDLPLEEEEPAPTKERLTGRLRDPGQGPGFFAGLHVGPAFALSPLKTSFMPRLELGVELPWVQRRFRVSFDVAWSRPANQGDASDDRVPSESWSWDLKQNEWTLGGKASVAILPPASGRVIPEAGIGVQAYLLTSRINGEAGGSDFPESTEVYAKAGPLIFAGVRVALGPGELTGHLAWHTAKLDGVVTGDSTAMQLVPSVGYRLVF